MDNPSPAATAAAAAAILSGAAPAPTPGAAPPQLGVPAVPAAAPTIPLSIEEYQRFRGLESQIADLQKANLAALEAKEAERLRALAEKGQIEEALSQQRTSWEQKHAEAQGRYAQLEGQVYSERKSAVLAEALAGRAFVGETPEAQAATASLVRRLLQDDFETTRDGAGTLLVREKVTGRPAAEVLRERLASSTYAIFFAPSNQPGSGSGSAGSYPPPGSEVYQPGQPFTLQEIVADWRNRQNQFQSFGLRGTPSK